MATREWPFPPVFNLCLSVSLCLMFLHVEFKSHWYESYRKKFKKGHISRVTSSFKIRFESYFKCHLKSETIIYGSLACGYPLELHGY
jgi:hypothetical protein